MSAPYGWEQGERMRRLPPDQDQRLDRDPHGIGRPRRARPWIAVALGLLVIAVFLVLLASGGGENSDEIGAPATAVAD